MTVGDFIVQQRDAALAKVAAVQAYASKHKAYGQRGLSVGSAQIASDLLGIVGDTSDNPASVCPNHRPRQHRDGKPPWCEICRATASAPAPTHRALDLRTLDGVPYVRCSCRPNESVQAYLWSATHFDGGPEEARAAIEALRESARKVDEGRK